MKKLLAVALVLCLLIPCAYAENIDSFLYAYDLQAKGVTGAVCLSDVNYTIVTDKQGKKYFRFETEEVIILIRDDFRSVNCQAREKNSAAFIRCCGALSLAIAGSDISYTDLFGNLLSQFYFAGTENKDLFSLPAVFGNYIFRISNENDIYSFTFMISDDPVLGR